MRGDSATHRLTPGEQPFVRARDMAAHVTDDRVVAGVENRPAVGQLSVLLGIGKVERDHVEAMRGQRLRVLHKKWATLTRTGPMGEDQRSPDRWSLSLIDERGDCAPLEIHRQLLTASQAVPSSRRRSSGRS